jgi:hypothetical protein
MVLKSKSLLLAKSIETNNSLVYIEKGFMDVRDDVGFKRIYEACLKYLHQQGICIE